MPLPLSFTPPTGLLDTSTYPTNPANETAARQQFMDLFYQLRDALNLSNPYVVDTGAANAYIVTLTPAPTTYTAGMVINFKVANANTGASTINVNGIGIKTIKKDVNVDLVSGDLLAGQIATCIYDGTYFQLLNPDFVVQFTNITNTASLASNGWFKDKKTGFIIQWGVVSTSTSGIAATFPIAFPSNVYGVIPNGISTGSVTYYTALTLTGATFWTTSGTPSAFYIAIGK